MFAQLIVNRYKLLPFSMSKEIIHNMCSCFHLIPPVFTIKGRCCLPVFVGRTQKTPKVHLSGSWNMSFSELHF